MYLNSYINILNVILLHYRLYNNGRMLDMYWRLHSSEDEIYIPYDLEISLPELDTICKKAEQWRGEEGERRKVAVYDYNWEEECVSEHTYCCCCYYYY